VRTPPPVEKWSVLRLFNIRILDTEFGLYCIKFMTNVNSALLGYPGLLHLGFAGFWSLDKSKCHASSINGTGPSASHSARTC
jgi:hypothetical protein